VATQRASASFIWFILGLVFLTLGMTNRRSRAFLGVGAAFVAIGFVKSRQNNPPPQA
jgi:uncharacterized membrane protein